MNESAITLGRIQVQFDCLYNTKEARRRLTKKDRVSELLKICSNNDVSFKGFEYLERKLILEREG